MVIISTMNVIDFLPRLCPEDWAATTVENHVTAMRFSEASQQRYGDCLPVESHISLQPRFCLRLHQNQVGELQRIWNSWTQSDKQLFNEEFGHIAYLLQVQIDEALIRDLIHFWDPYYRCFTFNKVDLMPTIEEYGNLLNLIVDYPTRVYMHNEKGDPIQSLSNFLEVPMVEVKGCIKGRYLPWSNVQHFLQVCPNKHQKRKAMALAIYGLIIFPRALERVDVNVIKLLDQMQERHFNPVPVILAETIRSLNFCRRNGGQFFACVHLLHIWIKSHLSRVKSDFALHFNKDFIPIQAFINSTWIEKQNKEEWIKFFRHLNESQITWRAHWSSQTQVLYRCGNCPWVPLLGLWGGISYAPALVRKQFNSLPFVPMTHLLNELEFNYDHLQSESYIAGIAMAWKRVFIVQSGTSIASELYTEWRTNRKEGVVYPAEEPTKRSREIEIEEENAVIKKMRMELAEKDAALTELKKTNQKLEEENTIIKKMRIELAEKDAALAELKKTNQKLEEKTQAQEDVIRAMANEFDQHTKQLGLAQNQIEKFVEQVREVTNQAGQMKEEAREIQALLSSQESAEH